MINHGLSEIWGCCPNNSHNIVRIWDFNGTPPIQQPFGIYSSRMGISPRKTLGFKQQNVGLHQQKWQPNLQKWDNFESFFWRTMEWHQVAWSCIKFFRAISWSVFVGFKLPLSALLSLGIAMPESLGARSLEPGKAKRCCPNDWKGYHDRVPPKRPKSVSMCFQNICHI